MSLLMLISNKWTDRFKIEKKNWHSLIYMNNIVLEHEYKQYVRHIIMNSEYHIPWRRKQSELCIQKKPHITVYLR